jgi:phenylalanyl-tRNA synthetase beta chain
MPTVDVDYDELRRLADTDRSDDELERDLFDLGLEYEGETEDGKAKLELEPDRLDRLSVEGIARSLRYQYGKDRGVYVPTLNDPVWTVEVEGVPEERPYVTAAVVRGVDLDEAGLESLIQLQEKLHATMGRKRAKGAIGIHDLAMLKGEAIDDDSGGRSIRYTGIDPDGDRFVPLDADAEMTPAEVVESHHIGADYADLVAEYDRYPAIYDEIGLFSFPPVINGRRTEVSTDSRELFVEMTGTDQWTIDHMLNVVCYALDARGAGIEAVEVQYPDRSVERPDFSTRTKSLAHREVEDTLGIDLDPEEVIDLAERSGLDAAREDEDGLRYEVTVPPYRVDVLHPVDLIDDVGRAYGFGNLRPRYPGFGTVGGRHERSRLERAVRTQLVGLGFQDLLNFHLASRRDTFDRMRIAPDDDALGATPPAEVTAPYSEEYEILRTWALPSVLTVLENNTHRAYPQDLAEVGFVAHRDPEENTGVAECRTVAAALARTDASYEDARGRLQAIARNFDAGLSTPPTDHPSFLPGRVAEVVLDGEPAGVVGELHPEVIVERDLEVPVVAFEFRLDALAD